MIGSVKPFIRPMELEDLGWLYGAHLMMGGEEDKESFRERMVLELSRFERVYMLEDLNKRFDSGFGPVGYVMVRFDGWTMEPHVHWLPWASLRSRLRCVVWFLMVKGYWAHDVGIVLLRVDKSSRRLFERLRDYMTIRKLAPIPNGFPDGPAYLFSIRGKKS